MLLYIHIPFCDSKCHYCSFNSYVDKFEQRDAYIDATITQFLHEVTHLSLKEKSIQTVFIGGGTPSTISVHLYNKLFAHIHPYLKHDTEITIEANPNSISQQWCEGLRELGVNRISIGVQSFNKKKLRYLGRNHTAELAKEAVMTAYRSGFKHISLDLIYDTPLDNKTLLFSDLEIAAGLPIDHISSYSLTIEENTLFDTQNEKPKDDEDLAFLFVNKIKSLGFNQYEISNFERGYSSKHNMGYWNHKEYLGIGAGAVGYYQKTRFYPSKDIDTYIKHPLEIQTEVLREDDIKMEKIFLGLRSCVGIDENILNESEKKRVKILTDEGKLYAVKGRYFNKDYFIADEIALFLS